MRLLSFTCKEILPHRGYNQKRSFERASAPPWPGAHRGPPLNSPISMPLFVLGINHNSAPLEVREKLAFPSERQGEALERLAGQPGVAEAVLVSTCNRTEVYCRAEDVASVREWLPGGAGRAGLSLHTD